MPVGIGTLEGLVRPGLEVNKVDAAPQLWLKDIPMGDPRDIYPRYFAAMPSAPRRTAGNARYVDPVRLGVSIDSNLLQLAHKVPSRQ